MQGNRLQLLREIAPTASVVAVVLNPGTPYTALAYRELEAAANVAKVQLRAFEVRSPEEIAGRLSVIAMAMSFVSSTGTDGCKSRQSKNLQDQERRLRPFAQDELYISAEGSV